MALSEDVSESLEMCQCNVSVLEVTIVSGRRRFAERGIILGIEKFSISHSIFTGNTWI